MIRLTAIFRGCLTGATLVCLAAVAVSAVFFYVSARMPRDAPLARMYRAETDITALATALDRYRQDYAVLPSSGTDGLGLALGHLSARADYFAHGVPLDPWGRPYVYVPAASYAEAGSGALRDADGGFCAPDSYQLYCVGADGLTGAAGAAARGDDITAWESHRPWREAYRALNAQYPRWRGKRTKD